MLSAALAFLRFGQTLKSPLTRRISTIGFFLSVPRRSLKTDETPAPKTVTVPVLPVILSAPFVTSTVELNGITPLVKGRPFTSTVPVVVPVGGVALPPPPVVVVVLPPPPPGRNRRSADDGEASGPRAEGP